MLPLRSALGRISSQPILAVLLLALIPITPASAEDLGGPTIQAQPLDGGRKMLYVMFGTAEAQEIGLTYASSVNLVSSGHYPPGFRWIIWSEDGAPFYSVSEDNGATWGGRKSLDERIRLKAGVILPGEAMPSAALRMPETGRLYIAQAKVPWTDTMRAAVRKLGCPPAHYIPHNAYLLRCRAPGNTGKIRELPFVARVESYECSYRLSPDLTAWLGENGPDSPSSRWLRAVIVEAGKKSSFAEAASSLGAMTGSTDGEGSLIDVYANRDQARKLACHDELAYLGLWHPSEDFMNNVRKDAKADVFEAPEFGGYCGTGVRGEVLESGLLATHSAFTDRVIVHGNVDPLEGAYDKASHGTSVFGTLFAAGPVDAQYRGMLPCAEGIIGDRNQFGEGGSDPREDRLAFTRDSKDACHASFQSNSWGVSADEEADYDADRYEVDEIVWKVDMALLQAAGNLYPLGAYDDRQLSRALSKNVITVGAVRHEDTKELDDDWWCYDCSVHNGQEAECEGALEGKRHRCGYSLKNSCYREFMCGRAGPSDENIKPDLGFWIDMIYTTDVNKSDYSESYRDDFDGTSAATPITAGVLGIILEMWADTEACGVNRWGASPVGQIEEPDPAICWRYVDGSPAGGPATQTSDVFFRQPHASTMKALLINSAEPYLDLTEFCRRCQGWGRANIRNAWCRAPGSLIVDEDVVLPEEEVRSWTVHVPPGEKELRVTLVYNDPPKLPASSGPQLLNDLDLRVLSPSDNGQVAVYCGNFGLEFADASAVAWTGNEADAPACDACGVESCADATGNVENVIVKPSAGSDEIPAGNWTVEVRAEVIRADQNVREECRNVTLDPKPDPEVPSPGKTECEALNCVWDEYDLCRDETLDVAISLVVSRSGSSVPGTVDTLMMNKIEDDGTFLELSWAASGGHADRYGVYRGDLTSGYDSLAAEPGQCAVEGTSTTIPTGSKPAEFFLVVPNTSAYEGEYGTVRSGDQTAPRGAADCPCFPAHDPVTCPEPVS